MIVRPVSRIATLAVLVAAGLLLGACGEKVQTAGTSPKAETKASQGAANGHVVKGWTPGDDASWQAQLRSRAQGQNEYARSAPVAKAP